MHWKIEACEKGHQWEKAGGFVRPIFRSLKLGRIAVLFFTRWLGGTKDPLITNIMFNLKEPQFLVVGNSLPKLVLHKSRRLVDFGRDVCAAS